jgi:DNA repair protein RadC
MRNKDTIELFKKFKVLLLNNSNIPLGIYTLSKGGITSTGVDLRLLFGVILKSGAVSFITVHNHPSKRLKPSKPDIAIYKKIVQIIKTKNLNTLLNN